MSPKQIFSAAFEIMPGLATSTSPATFRPSPSGGSRWRRSQGEKGVSRFAQSAALAATNSHGRPPARREEPHFFTF
eukprot:scaffold1875_cov253-Pinguiococcus_pyrenoidosus.AAC.15